MATNKLVGENYTTPDILAKVTGKAKYAEDFRADGMLFCKLLLSPMPHARVRRIDASEALAMPGVKAILTADDLPAPADSITDSGVVIKANTKAERALTNEPCYQGEPILAVAAIDELTAAEAIEKIKLDIEPMPFVIDPLDTLRPGSPNARPDGNVWARPPAPAPAAGAAPGRGAAPPPPPQIMEWKWTDADFAAAKDGQLPMGKATDEWSVGDIDAGFKSAALVVDESFVTPNSSHQCLETRTSMAYWQNGKLYMHCSTQSTAQTVPAVARWVGIDVKNVVVISEYTGGGFGSKVTSSIQLMIPALLSKKANAPVMMRISREEEHYIGRARPSALGRVKIGFNKEGRITAMDMFYISDNGPYEQQGDMIQSGRIASLLYQPLAMRWRGLTVLTNTPMRSAQSQPGGTQAVMIVENALSKAARQLKIDQVEIRKINAPAGKAKFGQAVRGVQGHVTSAFVREALDKGAETFKWSERLARSGKRSGTKVRGSGVAISAYIGGTTGFDGLFIIKPDGRIEVKSGIGNLGNESTFDVHRVAAEMLGFPWEKVDITQGDSSKHLPWSAIQGGSQTVHSMTRASHAAAMDAKKKLQEIAAKDLGGKPEDYDVGNEKVFHKGGGRSMTFAQAAKRAIELGGIYDGHEVPKDINNFTKTSVAALAGQGLIAVAKDSYPRDGQTHSFVAGFAEVEVDLETGVYTLLDYLAVGDVGTPLHPQNLGGQLLGRSILGIGHAIGHKWVFDKQYGVTLARRMYNNKPPTILDVPANMDWAAVGLPDPETPVGAKGIGEPPVGAGASAVLNAIAAAVGEEVFQKAPVTIDQILVSLETGKKYLPGQLSASV